MKLCDGLNAFRVKSRVVNDGIGKEGWVSLGRAGEGVSRLTRKLNSLSNVCTIASRNPRIESERGGRIRTRRTEQGDELHG